ncbi:M10 family metallopeptidase C-terminal domain-containing protein [Labrys portucalensis]|uniref:M10 family metallopeptidase C-terminal domain-containing protein n=1 Tax=Labrys neptuniae TaxID=376174 RepID=A0ABV6Z8R5_9HYPH
MSNIVLPTGITHDSVFATGAAGSTYKVNLDSYIISADNLGLQLDGGPWTVTINGGVSGLQGDGLAVNAPPTSTLVTTKVNVGTEGSIYGSLYGIGTNAALDVANSGIIRGDAGAIYYVGDSGSNLYSNAKISVKNLAGATISGGDFGIYNNSAATLTVTNAGTISTDSGYAIRSGGLGSITNSKLIQGDIGLFGGAPLNSLGVPTAGNTVTNTGEIDGSILINEGKNVVTNSGIVIGNDQLLTFADDTQRDVQVSIGLWQGNSTIKNSGKLYGTILGSLGADVISNTGLIVGDTAYGYDAGSEQYFQGALDLGAGNDSLTNGKEIDGAVWLGTGDDTATNTGVIYGFISAGNGNDKITNSGSVDGIDLGEGVNTLTNSKTIYRGVYGGDGGNTITNSGTIYGNVQTGAGNDKFTESGAGLVTGDFYLGAGNDTFVGGASVEYVHDQAGNDIYGLGAGNDVYFASNDGGTDKVDGSTGIDVFTVDPATTDPLNINLGTTAALGLNAQTATFGTSGGSENVKGFEIVWGTAGNDTIVGGAIAETLHGNDGNDIIAGGVGADILWGEGGNDIFKLLGVKDSGLTRAATDTIMDFTQGEDKIDLSSIDANSSVAGFQEFHSLIANSDFTGSSGELRYIFQGGQTMLQGDINGDKKADFQIAIQGTVNLQSSDIIGLT